MRVDTDFDGIAEFLAIAHRLSIRGAAIDLGRTPGAVSLALQRLEKRIGLPLFHRTTRKVALTDAGSRLLQSVDPAARSIHEGFEEVRQSASAPTGTLRLVVERLAISHVIERVLPLFRRSWPEVNVDITISNRQREVINDGFDAGISIGSYIEQDMIAVRLGKPFQWAVFGAPAYFSANGKPQVTSDLVRHDCIRFRRPEKGDIYRWEFIEDNQTVRIEPVGSLTVNDGELMRALAVQGVGLIYSSTLHSSRELASGQLEPALMDRSPGTDGLFLYFSKASRSQPKLRAFIEVCKEVLGN